MNEHARIKEFTNLYSMGLLPKIEGRYLTGPKPTSKLRLAGKRSDFSMEKAKTRLNKELRRIELSQRLLERSERSFNNRSLCRTEPVQPASPLARLNTIHIKSIDIASPPHFKHIKKPVSLSKQPLSLNPSGTISESIQALNISSIGRRSNHSKALKAKFGKRSLEEEKMESRLSPEGGQTIGQWVSNAQAQRTQNHFELYYSQERARDDCILQKWQEEKGASFHHIAIKKIQRSNRQLLFKSSHLAANSG